MANNPYVNKVELANGTTLIDLSSDTAVASDVAQGKYFHLATGERVQGTASGGGGSGGVIISDATDAAGGTIRTITAVEIAGTKSITENGTGIDVTSYESVDVNVPGYDMPKFVLTINPNTGEPTSVTCDKTFSEVNDYTQDGEWYSVVDLDYGGSDPSGLCGALYQNYSGQTLVSIDCYVEFSIEGVAQYKISYSSNGTLSAEFMPIPANDSSDLTASNLTVTAPAGYYASDATKTLSDANLIAGNIKKDVSIFGTTGTYEGGGGASNFVTGTFKGTETGVLNITIPYTGSGYPVSVNIFPSVGSYKTGSDINNLLQRYAIILYSRVKSDVSASPTYNDTSLEANRGSYLAIYKSSASNAASTANNGGLNGTMFTTNNAGDTLSTAVRFKDSKTLSVYIAGTSYGFPVGIDYTYQIVYSS